MTTQVLDYKVQRNGTSGLVVLLGILTAFAPFATDTYLAAFPAMAGDLGTDVGGIQLTLSVFFLGMGLGQLFYGPLIDRYGRRRPLLAGILLFTAASLGLALATSLPGFLLLRFIQALGGCAGMVAGRAVIQDAYGKSEAARVLSLMMAVQALGPVVAPIAGGYILGLFAWPSVFFGLCGLGLACFTATFLSLPETLPPERRIRQNALGIIRTFRKLLGTREFLIPALAGGLGLSTLFVFISGSPFVLMNLYGLNETSYGWAFGLFAFGMAGATQLNSMMLKRFRPESMLPGCLLCSLGASGALALVLVTHGLPPMPVFLALLFFSLLTGPVVAANTTAMAMAMAAGGRNSGSASSLLGALHFACAGSASALTGALHNGTALPMACMIMACGLSSLVLVLISRNRAVD